MKYSIFVFSLVLFLLQSCNSCNFPILHGDPIGNYKLNVDKKENICTDTTQGFDEVSIYEKDEKLLRKYTFISTSSEKRVSCINMNDSNIQGYRVSNFLNEWKFNDSTNNHLKIICRLTGKRDNETSNIYYYCDYKNGNIIVSPIK